MIYHGQISFERGLADLINAFQDISEHTPGIKLDIYGSERVPGTIRQLEQIIAQCAALDNAANRETSLLIFPRALSDFEDYLDMLEIATALLEKQGYEGVYQLASFHPKYCFAEAAPDDASNYTNRSPYPMLHILREASVEAALENFPNPENIPDRNIQLTKGLGLTVMKKLLADCYK